MSDHDTHSTGASLGKYLLGQAGLAGTSLAGKQYHPSPTSQDCVQRRQDPRQLGLPSDESPSGPTSRAGASHYCSPGCGVRE
jgi:hypothetical protein